MNRNDRKETEMRKLIPAFVAVVLALVAFPCWGDLPPPEGVLEAPSLEALQTIDELRMQNGQNQHAASPTAQIMARYTSRETRYGGHIRLLTLMLASGPIDCVVMDTPAKRGSRHWRSSPPPRLSRRLLM